MDARVQGKVALVTGAGRGQGRSHAVRLAEEGADIIALDLCKQTESVPYPLSTEEDLAVTVAAVEELDRRIVARKADVRDLAALEAVVEAGLSEFGQIDIVLANAGIFHQASLVDLTESEWRETIDVNLTGVFNTMKATVPQLLEQGTGGTIVITASGGGVRSWPNMVHYCAAKHGVVGLMRSLANELGPADIRVNCVAPSAVNTRMIQNEASWTGMGTESSDEFAALFRSQHLLPYPWAEPRNVSDAILWLSSEEGCFVTGAVIPVDLGLLEKTTA